MSDSEILSELIKKSAQVFMKEENNKFCADFTEPSEPNSQFRIFSLPLDAIIVKADAFCAPDTIFNGGKGECKRADYIIISEEKKCIIYMEVKLAKEKREHIIKQLKGAQCFMDYCQFVGKRFWNEANFLHNYKHRFVCIKRTSINKRGTQAESKENSGKHDTPENMLSISAPNHVTFNKLASLSK